MTRDPGQAAARRYDVAIIGGGLVGASLACALAPLGLKLALIEAVPFRAASQPSYDDRTLALSASSCRILETLPKAAFGQCRQLTEKSLELDGMLAEAHAMMAILQVYEYDWKGAEREFLRALELNPKSEDVWEFYDYSYLVPMRRLDEAVAASRRALELDPLRPFLQRRLGIRYYLTRQWDLAIEQFRNALELDPHYVGAHFYLRVAYCQEGRFEEALRSIETYSGIEGRLPSLIVAGYGVLYALAGRAGEAQRHLSELEQIAQKEYVPPSRFAWIYCGLGEIDRCLDWLEKAEIDFAFFTRPFCGGASSCNSTIRFFSLVAIPSPFQNKPH